MLLRLREVAGLSLTEATHPPDLQVPPHSHEDAHFCLLLQGRYEENCGKHIIVRKPSTLALMASGAIHSNRIHSTGIRFLSIEMTRPWLNRANGRFAFIRGLTQFDTGPLPWLAMRLYHEFRSEDDVAPLAIEGLLLELLAGVTRQTSHSENGNAKWLSRARDFVHDRFQESISLAEVAEFAEVHRSVTMFAGFGLNLPARSSARRMHRWSKLRSRPAFPSRATFPEHSNVLPA